MYSVLLFLSTTSVFYFIISFRLDFMQYAYVKEINIVKIYPKQKKSIILLCSIQ